MKKLINFKFYTFCIGVFFLTCFTCTEALGDDTETPEIPVLVYHCINNIPPNRINDYMYVTPEHFENQLAYLKKEGYTAIFAKDLDKPLPSKPIVITLDDGYKDNYYNAFALLKKYNMKATIFLVGAPTERQKYNKLSWTDMRIMLTSQLVDIQSHTYNLHAFKNNGDSLAAPYPNESLAFLQDRIKKDIQTQKELFKRQFDYAPTVFAYPNGYYSTEIDNFYREEGYTVTFTIDQSMANLQNGSYLLPRIPVHDNDNLANLLSKYSTPIDDPATADEPPPAEELLPSGEASEI